MHTWQYDTVTGTVFNINNKDILYNITIRVYCWYYYLLYFNNSIISK